MQGIEKSEIKESQQSQCIFGESVEDVDYNDLEEQMSQDVLRIIMAEDEQQTINKMSQQNQTLRFPPQYIDPNKLQNLYDLEHQIFELNDNDMDQLRFYNHKIDFHGDNFLHVLETVQSADEESKPLLFIAHGYGGSLVTFINLINFFRDRYHIFAFDHLGQGLSSRPVFDVQDMNNLETIDFFMDSMDILIRDVYQQQKTNKKIYLMGHSFGGYIMSQYAIKNYEIIDNLYLLSPVGITYQTEECIEKMKQDYQKQGIMKKAFLKLLTSIFNKKFTPSSLFKKMGILGKIGMKRALIKRLQLDEKRKDFEPFREYFMQMYQLPISSEKCLFNILNFDKATKISAIQPIEKIIQEQTNKLQNIQILFFYGDRDWMEYKGALRLSKNNSNISFYVVKDSSHHVNMSNPEFMFKYIKLCEELKKTNQIQNNSSVELIKN